MVRQAAYGDAAALTAALDGVDRLLLISTSGAGTSTAHRSVIEAAKTTGVGHIAYTSILNADTSGNPLAGEHAATERLLADSDIPATILRNAWYHEYYTQFMLPVFLAAGEVIDATGDARISGAARKDLAAAAARVLTDPAVEVRIHELGGTPFTMEELTRTINEVRGVSLVHRGLTKDEFTAELQKAGYDEGMARSFAGSDASIERGDMFTDSDDLAQLIGRPLTPLAETVRQTR